MTSEKIHKNKVWFFQIRFFSRFLQNMEVSFSGIDGQPCRVEGESTVGDLLKKIHDQLGLEDDRLIVITWGPHRLVAEQSVEEFIEFVDHARQENELSQEWQMTIHVL